MEHCDWCNKTGHGADTHPEARADIAAWKREVQKEEFPFGDHKEED